MKFAWILVLTPVAWAQTEHLIGSAIRGRVSNSCILCNDVGTDWMVNHAEDCPSSHLLERKCNKNANWIQNKFCRQSCYKAGFGYTGDVCCDTASPSVFPTTSPSTTPSMMPVDLPSSSPSDKQSHTTVGCIICNDVGTDWMVNHAEDCPSSHLLEKKCNKNANWVQNKFCRQSCYKAGLGYMGDVCCDTASPSVFPTTSPSTTPSTLPSGIPSSSPSDKQSQTAGGCIICNDVGTDWMVNHAEDCPSSDLLEKKCNKNANWMQNKICRQSCYKAGFGYTGDVCCETASPSVFPTTSPSITPSTVPSGIPSSSPSVEQSQTSGGCVFCDDVGTDWMVNNKMECHSSYLIERKCNKNANWVNNQFCRLSCYNAGYEYSGDECCNSNRVSQVSSAPSNSKVQAGSSMSINSTSSPSNSPAPSPAPSVYQPGPSSMPSFFPTQSPRPTPTPSSSPTVTPSPTQSSMPSLSLSPTKVPSFTPSISDMPTNTHKPSLSKAPTEIPSITPTFSLSPSTEPTETSRPSPSPTVPPTKSLDPSTSPSTSPSTNPSYIPFTITTSTPTSAPTSAPTTMTPTTTTPTRAPSSQPTATPSVHPTRAPSSQPTATPSIHPSENPTPSDHNEYPTYFYRIMPTPAPSSIPTKPIGPLNRVAPPTDTRAPSRAPATSAPTGEPTSSHWSFLDKLIVFRR